MCSFFLQKHSKLQLYARVSHSIQYSALITALKLTLKYIIGMLIVFGSELLIKMDKKDTQTNIIATHFGSNINTSLPTLKIVEIWCFLVKMFIVVYIMPIQNCNKLYSVKVSKLREECHVLFASCMELKMT